MGVRWAAVCWVGLVACGPEPATNPRSPDAPPPVGDDPPVDLSGVVLINEVMPDNESTVNGPDGTSLPDWVEIVNASRQSVSTKRISLESEGGRWQGNGDRVLAPGERMMIWFDEARDLDNPWTGFRLGKADDFVILFVDGLASDEVQIAGLGEDVSIARTPDIVGPLVPTARPTPNDLNEPTSSETLDTADETLFITHKMHKIEFHLTPENLQAIDGGDRPVVHAEAVIDGIRYRDIGVGLKGSASYDSMSGKPAFKVKLNEWLPGVRFRGQRAFGLHNGLVLDPTRTRDYISHSLAREAGLMAPRVGWAEVWANDEYLGLYVIIERAEEEFIEYRRPGHGETGFIFEGNETEAGGWAQDFGGWAGVPDFDQEEGPNPPPPGVAHSIQKVNDIVKGSPTDAAVKELWKYVHKRQFLTYMAWESVVQHRDGYKAPNNWRFYVDPETHELEWVPSGADWTWDYNSTPGSFGGRVAEFCVQNLICAWEYSIRLLEIADLAEDMELLDTFYDLSSWLDLYIDQDPRYYYKWGGSLETARQSTAQHLTNNPTLVRQWVKQSFPDL